MIARRSIIIFIMLLSWSLKLSVCCFVFQVTEASDLIWIVSQLVQFCWLVLICFLLSWDFWQSLLLYQNLNRVLLVHLWMRSVKELLKVWKIFLILMMKKGWYIIHLWLWKFTLEKLLMSIKSTGVILSTSAIKEWKVCLYSFKSSLWSSSNKNDKIHIFDSF